MTRWRAPDSESTPSMVIVEVPAPVILAPMALRHSARLTTSGSRAAFSSTVSPLGERCRHHQHMGGADRDLGEGVAVAGEAVPGLGHDIAVFDLDLGAKRLQAVDEQVDRPRADGTTAGQRHLGLAHAGKQRPDDPEAGAHLGDQLVRSRGVDDVARGRS
jgi:hypothetical protein